MTSLENDHEKCEIRNPLAFLFTFSHWHVKGCSSKRTALKVDVIQRQRKWSVCRRVRASFSPETLLAVAVKGLTAIAQLQLLPRSSAKLFRDPNSSQSGEESQALSARENEKRKRK